MASKARLKDSCGSLNGEGERGEALEDAAKCRVIPNVSVECEAVGGDFCMPPLPLRSWTHNYLSAALYSPLARLFPTSMSRNSLDPFFLGRKGEGGAQGGCAVRYR